MDVSKSAAHKRIRMEMMKRNSLKTGIDLSTMTREQAMALRTIDPELKDFDHASGAADAAAPAVKRVASPAAANKRTSLPDLRVSGGKSKNSKNGTIDVGSFSLLPVLGISKNNSQSKPVTSSSSATVDDSKVTVETSRQPVAAGKRKSAPQILSPVAERPAQTRRPLPPLNASNKKRASAGPSEISKAVIAGITAAGVSSAVHSQDLTAKYTMGEVIVLTLSDGRPMCGEIVNLTKETMLVEYSENKIMYRALIKVEYDPDNEDALDDLVSVMEVPL
eukprot:TRINITY_DN883_c0_g1_i1.p1 TRINITY_DN883_c0_g1~~TRINITY_DN883_c0_g1_i1.p1  ORF type:complete len:278 (-),score=80.07 TRINITY_DN883_c0_g1_i1:39-872(-)